VLFLYWLNNAFIFDLKKSYIYLYFHNRVLGLTLENLFTRWPGTYNDLLTIGMREFFRRRKKLKPFEDFILMNQQKIFFYFCLSPLIFSLIEMFLTNGLLHYIFYYLIFFVPFMFINRVYSVFWKLEPLGHIVLGRMYYLPKDEKKPKIYVIRPEFKLFLKALLIYDLEGIAPQTVGIIPKSLAPGFEGYVIAADILGGIQETFCATVEYRYSCEGNEYFSELKGKDLTAEAPIYEFLFHSIKRHGPIKVYVVDTGGFITDYSIYVHEDGFIHDVIENMDGRPLEQIIYTELKDEEMVL